MGDEMIIKEDFEETLILNERRSNAEADYTYRLLTRKSSVDAPPDIVLYTIEIQMTTRCGEKTHAQANNTFISKQDAINFFYRLVDNFATPLNLDYIIEDEVIS